MYHKHNVLSIAKMVLPTRVFTNKPFLCIVKGLINNNINRLGKGIVRIHANHKIC